MSLDDRAILLRTHRGHEPSARLLWERHAPAMLALAGAIVRDRTSISPDDIVQSVFCRVLEVDRGSLRGVRDVRAWLCQVTRRLALNEIRAQRRERGRRRHVMRAAQSTTDVASGDVAGAVMALPRRMREVVVLKHAGGLTFDQIALALDMPRSTAASRYRGAIDRLREQLCDEVPQEVAHG